VDRCITTEVLVLTMGCERRNDTAGPETTERPFLDVKWEWAGTVHTGFVDKNLALYSHLSRDQKPSWEECGWAVVDDEGFCKACDCENVAACKGRTGLGNVERGGGCWYI
jgi:hypothetical protein